MKDQGMLTGRESQAADGQDHHCRIVGRILAAALQNGEFDGDGAENGAGVADGVLVRFAALQLVQEIQENEEGGRSARR